MKLLRCGSFGCVAVLAALCSRQISHAHEGHAALPSTGVVRDDNQLLISAAAIKAIGMKTETISFGDIQHTLHVNARVELPWSGQAKVTTLTAGKIERVLVKPGETVKAGQELARVESLELELLQAKLLQTAAEIELLERLIRLREPLVASGSIAGKVLLESKTELQQKQAQHGIVLYKLQALGVDRKAIDALLQAGETIRWIPVVSPIAGTIARIDTRPGQLVESTEHLFDIVDLSTLYVVGEVLESDAYQVRVGLPVVITLTGRSNVKLIGHIDHIRMKMDEAIRSLKVVVTVDNRAGLLRPGMFGRMAIEVAAAKQQIVCPTSALIETENGIVVFKRESKGKFSRCPIKIGMRSSKFVVVESGLFPGQRVISRGTNLLAAMFDGVPLPKSPAGTVQSKDQTPRVSTQPARSRIDYVLAAKALVELPTSQKAFATSLIEGRVAAISVAPGQAVEAGDTLAEVESQQLRNVQLELLQAAGKMRWTRGEVDRLRPLAESGKTSTREFWQRELELKTLSQQVFSLQRRLSLIGLRDREIQRLRTGKLNGAGDGSAISGRIAIRSPISGRVAAIGMTLGQIVHAHDSLFEIQNTNTVWIKALVLESDAARIKPGQTAVATFPSHPNLRVSGNVVRLSPQLVSRERVLSLWIELPNPQGFLKDGMLARVQIGVPRQPEAAVVRTVPAK
jgi:RND family efflux transporter MFP subunit